MKTGFNRLDQEGLAQIGVAFENREEGRKFAELIREELEVRIGEKISSGMNEAQLDEFDSLHSDSDVEAWLANNCPNYKTIVATVSKRLKEELLQYRDRIEGLQSTPKLRENGVKLTELGLNRVIMLKLRMTGIDTYGELSAIEDLETVERLNTGDIAELEEMIHHVIENGIDSVRKMA